MKVDCKTMYTSYINPNKYVHFINNLKKKKKNCKAISYRVF